ncbi:MAG: DUF1800 domain-containing protein [Chloroflexi bacterium]|nr:DUF1800 domain-containing protein [Chloroflexota bacterium]
MSLSRRDFLRLGALTAAATAAGCTPLGRQLAQDELPETLAIPTRTAASAPNQPPPLALRLLNRAGYGPRPGQLEQVQQMGWEAYLEEQLNHEAVEDTAVNMLVQNLSIGRMDSDQLINLGEPDVVRELLWATLIRQTYSHRQLYEAMVEFWGDHFHIYLHKSMYMPALKALDDRDVIRPHALGNFRDLLFASAYSPAMLHYLDNARNTASAPNENYGRELLELHTLGVHAGYTQEDVMETARILTGLSITRREGEGGTGQKRFNPEQHDNGRKVVLGEVFPAGQGEADIAQLLDFLASHPATADFIATKLVRRFVADEPPPALVSGVAQTFLQTGGDIKSMLRLIFLSPEFAQAPPKLKRPLTYVVSALRATGADVKNGRQLAHWLRWLGQLPFTWPAPNGYPDVATAWVQTLLTRWNFALALATGEMNGVTAALEPLIQASGAATPTAQLDLWATLTLGRPLDAPTQALFTTYLGTADLPPRETAQRTAEALALLLASPAFQWT